MTESNYYCPECEEYREVGLFDQCLACEDDPAVDVTPAAFTDIVAKTTDTFCDHEFDGGSCNHCGIPESHPALKRNQSVT